MEGKEGTERVHIFDTTLRDGEQSPGISLSVEEKVEIAQQLGRLKVDVIEAGFPITSEGDFESVSRIASEVRGPIITGLARVHEADIVRAWEAVQWSERPRIHTFVGTSDLHIEHQMRSNKEDIVKMAREAVGHAKSLSPDVEFSPMDATRTDIGFLSEVVAAAVEAGADVVNIADTVGYTTPVEFAAFLRDLKERVPELAERTLSVHCHDDLGLAVANSLAGVTAGARQIEVAVNGIGERAGNASLEEVVMALATREDFYGVEVGTETRQLSNTSRLISNVTGYDVPPNKAIVGRNAFAHESGIHQDGVLKDRRTFEIMKPEDIGLDSNNIFLGKHSGRHALSDALAELGYHLEGEPLKRAFERFKEIADHKKSVTAADLEAIAADEVGAFEGKYVLESFRVVAATGRQSRAAVTISHADHGTFEAEAEGDGPVDSVFRAVDAATGVKGRLTDFRIDAVTGGKDALGEVRVTVEFDGAEYSGRGLSQDVVDAAARAYVRAANVYATGKKLSADWAASTP
ncbi:2-isopropylmalate synthase [Rubrobacter aplysinae]|uniref:2-isopropylmalate synthase n=1 Tax=Rubrobacter aplysinae TaxID=909625 RepID=UPI00064B8560|nr:2-isopropylmalate synthase [Rubrobacter aplysinae]